ncbi:MAG TPA: polysaccharide lyase family protein [Phycisphaerae bacterium]|nr:polysaccharide lyase family protein [Phycisphaerae bacterium]
MKDVCQARWKFAGLIAAGWMGVLGAAVSAAAAPVTVTDNGGTWTMDNGIVKATIDKRNARMPSLVYKGINTMGGGGYWEQSPGGTLTQTVTIDPAKNGGERGEVAVKGVGGRGFDMEFRYTLARGESGIHVYGIYTHHAGTPRGGVGESRYITKLNHDFNWISVDKDRDMLECTPEDWGNGVVVHAKEQRILSTGYYKNSVEHKYTYNAIQYKIPAYGWSSVKDHIGIWFINPTTEYLGGGSSKMELVCHYDANDNPDPIILDYWSAGHYAGGASASVPENEEWTKVIGPIFVYCNTIDKPEEATPRDLATLEATAGNPTVPPEWKHNADVLFADALSQAKKEKAAWPYDWVEGVDYPHKDQRATVTGQLVLEDPQASSTKLPGLTVGLAHADYPGNSPRSGNDGIITWDHDANYYQFWTDGSDDGKFTLTNVRAGSYTLHAYANGVLGEFAKTNITVEPGKAIDLGKLSWTPLRLGKQVWEIGYADRTGGEFFKGDDDNYWLWGWGLRYPLLFPNDVTYTIGKSDYHKDWFFEQVPHSETTAWENPEAKDAANQRFGWVKAESLQQYPHTDTYGPWDKEYGMGRATTWKIKFDMPAAGRGRAVLRIALAGSDSTAGLQNPGAQGGLAVGVNAQPVGTVRFISTNALRYNTNRGVWRQYVQPFDASLLKAGENEIELTVPAGEVTSGVVYDYLRLEINEDAKPDAPVPDPMKP